MIKLGNEEHNIETFLFPELYPEHPDGDCQGLVIPKDIIKSTKRRTPARTPANRPFGNSKQSYLWEYSQYFDNLLYKKDFADAALKQMKDAYPDYSPEYAITLNTMATATSDAEIFIKDFSNRLQAQMGKGIKKEDRVKPKLIATMEYSQSGYKHYHAELDTSGQVPSLKHFAFDLNRKGIPKARFV